MILMQYCEIDFPDNFKVNFRKTVSLKLQHRQKSFGKFAENCSAEDFLKNFSEQFQIDRKSYKTNSF